MADFVLPKLKFIFYLWAQSKILLKSSFKQDFERTSWVTVETKEVSSAKSFGLECKFSVKSIMWTTKSGGPTSEPSGTLALLSAHEECWLFKTTLSFLLLRK